MEKLPQKKVCEDHTRRGSVHSNFWSSAFLQKWWLELSESTFSWTIATNLGSASDLAPAHKEFQHNTVLANKKKIAQHLYSIG